MIDLNVRAERMGWLPSAPQLAVNPLTLAAEAERAALRSRTMSSAGLKSGAHPHGLRGSGQSGQFPAQSVHLALEPVRLVRQGARIFPASISSARGTGCRARTSARWAARKPEEVAWRDPAPEGKLDLVVTLDFRMSTSCLYSDVVLPTATWYEKNDLNTTDMHPFIHPLSAAVDPVWESRSDWETYKTIARRFSELANGHLGVERDVVLTPIHARHRRPSSPSPSRSGTGRRASAI